MVDNATIIVTVNYMGGAGNTPASPAQVTDSIDTSKSSSLSGSADSSGSSTDKTVPNADGGSDNTKQHNPVPAGTIFLDTTVKITITCPDGGIKTLEGTGTVSASGSVLPGNCITITTANTGLVGHRIRKTITSTKKICC